MPELPQLQTFSLRDMDRTRRMEDLLRSWYGGRTQSATRPAAENDSWLSSGAASVLGTLASGYFGNRAASRATDAQLAASQAAMDEQRRQFDQTRTDLAPYRERSVTARNQLAMMMGINPEASYGGGDVTRNPLWNTGYQRGEQYTPSETANALSRYLRPPQRGNFSGGF